MIETSKHIKWKSLLVAVAMTNPALGPLGSWRILGQAIAKQQRTAADSLKTIYPKRIPGWTRICKISSAWFEQQVSSMQLPMSTFEVEHDIKWSSMIIYMIIYDHLYDHLWSSIDLQKANPSNMSQKQPHFVSGQFVIHLRTLPAMCPSAGRVWRQMISVWVSAAGSGSGCEQKIVKNAERWWTGWWFGTWILWLSIYWE